MNPIDLILGKVRATVAATAAKFAKVDAEGRPGEEIEAVDLIQHHGFASRPPAGAAVVFIRKGRRWVSVAEDAGKMPPLADGEAALFFDADHFVIMKADGSIAIKASQPVTIDAPKVITTGEVEDHFGTLDQLRQKFNAHKHIGNLGAPTSPPDSPDV